MQRFMLRLLVIFLGLATTTLAQAANKPAGKQSGGSQSQPPRAKPISNSLPAGSGSNTTNGTPLSKKLPAVSNSQHQPATLHSKHVTTSHGHAFLTKHAVKHHYGYSFHGKHHSHWTYQCYSRHYGCTIYWCPYASCYYYWCAPHHCYYPVSYCPTGVFGY